MNIIIDRFEGRFAICEVCTSHGSEQFFMRIPRALLPDSADEGDALKFESCTWMFDEVFKDRQTDESNDLRKRLFI